ncbi:MAG: hypothetical protein RL339_1845 [Pseudomonadota bacterium]|jgi:uncharacterized membrane protein YciS (DUF1049 family)
MQVIRTLLLILITIVIVSFIAINWQSVPLNLWPIANGDYLYVEWPVGLIFIVGIVLGFLPMWLLHKGVRWRLNRRIGLMENTVKASSMGQPSAVGTTTQLEAETSKSQDPA